MFTHRHHDGAADGDVRHGVDEVREEVGEDVGLGPNSIEKFQLEFWLEKPLEFWLEIPYTKKMFKNG